MLFTAGRAIPALVRHLAGYAELVSVEAQDAVGILKRRAVLAVVSVVAAHFALLLGLLFVIVLAWDTPYRAWTIGLLAAGFALVAVIAAWRVSRGRGELFGRVRAEWEADRELLNELKHGGRYTEAGEAGVGGWRQDAGHTETAHVP